MITGVFDRLLGGVVVIAANAGGAWTPIGDVTTTMLWIHGQISTLQTMKVLLLWPLFICSVIVNQLCFYWICTNDRIVSMFMPSLSCSIVIISDCNKFDR